MACRFKNEKLFGNNQGFSLVSVMVAASIFAIIAMAMTETINSMMKVQNYVARAEDASIMKHQLTSILSAPLNCMLTFAQPDSPQQPLKLDRSLAGSDSNIQQKSSEYVIKDPASGYNFSIDSYRIGQVEAEWLAFQITAFSGADTAVGLIYIGYEESFQNQYKLAPKRIPIELMFAPGTGTVVACRSILDGQPAGVLANSSSGADTDSTNIKWGSCDNGEYLYGINEDGDLMCETLPVVNPDGTLVTAARVPASTGSKKKWGCEGSGCVTFSGLPCKGMNCVTNGDFCDGMNCVAYGPNPSCDGMKCWAGPLHLKPKDD